jgi:sulfate transport system permease protein
MSSGPASRALERPSLRRRAPGWLPGSGRSRGGAGGNSIHPRLSERTGTALGGGLLGVYLSVLVLLPIAALLTHAASGGTSAFWQSVSNPEALAALKLTLVVSAIVVAINALFGTLIAWVLVRDEFPGKGIVNALIDLPFALPTIVAGVVLLALYGKGGPAGIDITFTRSAVGLALLFVTLPFVVRSVQPVLIELDRSMEEAANSLGAGSLTVFRRIVLPNLVPAILSGVALSFARALGEFGSVVLISGNLPFKTEVGSVYIFNQVENDNVTGAAAVSVVLLTCALVVLAAMNWLSRRGSRHVL